MSSNFSVYQALVASSLPTYDWSCSLPVMVSFPIGGACYIKRRAGRDLPLERGAQALPLAAPALPRADAALGGRALARGRPAREAAGPAARGADVHRALRAHVRRGRRAVD